MVKTLEEVYKEAEAFVQSHFPELNAANQSANRRITILSIIKAIVELEDIQAREHLDRDRAIDRLTIE